MTFTMNVNYKGLNKHISYQHIIENDVVVVVIEF